MQGGGIRESRAHEEHPKWHVRYATWYFVRYVRPLLHQERKNTWSKRIPRGSKAAASSCPLGRFRARSAESLTTGREMAQHI